MLLEKIEECEDVVVRVLGNRVIGYTAKDIVDFIVFAREHIAKIRENGRVKRADHIQTTINALVDFIGSELNISNITSRFLQEFEVFLRSERTLVRKNQ